MLFESASVKDGAIKAFLSLFPAHAGVIPIMRQPITAISAFPRARGGDPGIGVPEVSISVFSPRTRG